MREVKAGDIIRVKLDANMAEQINDHKMRASFTCFRTEIVGVEHPNGGWVPARGAPLRFVKPEHADDCLVDKIRQKIREYDRSNPAVDALCDLLGEITELGKPVAKASKAAAEKAIKQRPRPREAHPWLDMIIEGEVFLTDQRGFKHVVRPGKAVLVKGAVELEFGLRAVKIRVKLKSPKISRYGRNEYAQTHNRIGGCTYKTIKAVYGSITAYLQKEVPGEVPGEVR